MCVPITNREREKVFLGGSRAVRAQVTVPSLFTQSTTFEMWDTAGQERYRSLDSMRMYLRGAVAAVVVVDLTNSRTFETAKRMITQLQSGEVGADPDIVVAIALNKCDLSDPELELNAIQAYAAKQKISLVLKTSAKTGEGVSDFLSALAAALPPPKDMGGEDGTGLTLSMPPKDYHIASWCF